jgi:ribosomal protein S18 acetylase RimI-like enzyme
MGQLYTVLTRDEIAAQIATLLNTYNRLERLHDIWTITTSAVDYFVELMGDKVVGCVGLSFEGQKRSTIKHLCVDPSARTKGLGKKLVSTAIKHCRSEYVFATVRPDNVPSLHVFMSLGFKAEQFIQKHNHEVILMRRKVDGPHYRR